MRIKVKSYEVINETTILVSGLVNKNPFDDLEVRIIEFIDFVRIMVPTYFLKFCSIEATELETDLFDQERLLDEIDYGILAKYILESDL